MMKRLISFITMLCVLAMCFCIPAGADDTVSAAVIGQAEFNQLKGLGIMVGDEDNNPRLEDNMTRAEFAQLLQNILTFRSGSDTDDLSAWANNFYGENTDYDVIKYPGEGAPVEEAYFIDVPKDHWAYEPVKLVRQLGIMKGTSEGVFSPNDNIRFNEVVKCLVVMLGYDTVAQATGGYPGGYLVQAQRLKLLTGVDTSEYIARGSIAVMLINAFDASMLEISSIGDGVSYEYDSNVTFASEVLGIDKVTGVMTDNGYTSMLGASSYDGEYVVVDNVIIEVPDDMDLTALIGRDVDVWYTNDNSDDPGVAVYAGLSGNDSVLYIDSESISEIADNEIFYMSENGNVKKADISDCYVIKNGMAVTSFTKDIFDVDSGSLEIVEHNSSHYSKIVLVNSLETWYVNSVDVVDKIIYNGLKSGLSISADDILELDFDDPSYKITILNADGSEAEFENISKGSVIDVQRSGKVIKIIVTKNVITDFAVNEIYSDEYSTTISNSEMEFKLSGAYEDYLSGRDEIRVGDNLTLYLNSRGYVAYAEKSVDSDLSVGYLMDSAKDSATGLTDAYSAQIFDIIGVCNVYSLAEKLTVSDNTGKESKMTAKDFVKSYNSSNQTLIRYSVNDDNEITYVEIPIDDKDTEINGKLHLILETTEETKESLGNFQANQINSFGGRALLNSNSKVIMRKPDAEDEDDYSIGDMSEFGDDTDNIVKLYTDLEGSPVGKYVVYETESEAAEFNTNNTTPYLYVIKKIVQGTFPDEQTGYIIKAASFKMKELKDEELYLEEGVIDNVIVEAETIEGTVTTHEKFDGKLEPGDIIRVAKNADGRVTDIRIIWDENGIGNGRTTPGALPGFAEYYHSDNYNTNPWAINNYGTQLYAASNFDTGTMRVYNGFPYKVRDGAVILTTYDLPVLGYDKNMDETKYINEVWNIVRVFTVDLTNFGKVNVSIGSAADIKPYDEYGPNCSRIVNIVRYGTINGLVVVNGYYEE